MGTVLSGLDWTITIRIGVRRMFRNLAIPHLCIRRIMPPVTNDPIDNYDEKV